MIELVEANWPWLLAALLIGLLVAWLIFAGNRRTRITREEGSPEGESAQAKRNQALIDAPAAAQREGTDTPPIPPATPLGVAGAGTAVAAAVEQTTVAREEEAQTPPPPPPAEPAPAPAPKPKPEPTTAPTPAPASAAFASAPAADGSDLTRIKGLGPKLAARLQELGVTSIGQIAAWSDADVARIDAELGRFSGRIERDDWRAQARLLEAGDTAAYEAKFGKL